MTFAPDYTVATPSRAPRQAASRRREQRIAAIRRSILRAMNLVLDDFDAQHARRLQRQCQNTSCRRAKACRHSPCAMLAPRR
ncbi:MAG TPA: hypothetical protein VFL51_01420 [Pseudolabrys sp.]|nr:hypothetical protein [Pseudolabrys sp.]